jgi:hypothetical protein
MGLLKLLARAVRRIFRFPLVQLLIVVALILMLQSADVASLFGQIFSGLDKLVESTIALLADVFVVRAFTRAWLTFSLMICYVYLICLLVFYILRLIAASVVLVIARTNMFGLRNSIARERGFAAYRAWLPFERIRPSHISQQEWEERFAWPPNNEPPYPSLGRRMLAEIATYLVLAGLAVVLLQIFTPIRAMTWIAERVQSLLHTNPLR